MPRKRTSCKTIDRPCNTCGKQPALYQWRKDQQCYRGDCFDCRSKKPAAHKQTDEYKDKYESTLGLALRKQSWRRRRDALKLAVAAAYGGHCYCCGEDDIRFLTLDHVANDGATHRREIGLPSGINSWRWAKQNGYPPTFQLSCWNCNCGKVNNGGICPHQESRLALVA